MSVAMVPGMRKTAWPLYFTIAVAAASSMATSAPYRPHWDEARVAQGPLVRLDDTLAADTADFTVRLSEEFAVPSLESSLQPLVHVVGVVNHEIEGAPQYLRVALVTDEQTIVADQSHHLEGTGQFVFSMTLDEMLGCKLADPGVCEQTLTVVFDAEDVPAGVIDIEWYVRASASGPDEVPPADLVFARDVERGQPVDFIPELVPVTETIDEPGDGRWLMADSWSLYVATNPDIASNTAHFTMRGTGGFSSSVLSLSVGLVGATTTPVPARLTLLGDEPGAGVVAEWAAAVGGSGSAQFEFELPEPLDCPFGGTCERGFTLVLETDSAVPRDARALVSLRTIIKGEGEYAPGDTSVDLTIDPPAQ
jgi:hypothetical protein